MNPLWKRWLPTLMVLAIFLSPLILINPKTYITITISGLAMGMLLFLVSSGFSLIFGFLSVLNLAHGALFTWGAYIGFTSFTLINKWTGWGGPDSILFNIVIFLLTLTVAGLLRSPIGYYHRKISDPSCLWEPSFPDLHHRGCHDCDGGADSDCLGTQR